MAKRAMRGWFSEHDGATVWQKCDTCGLVTGEGFASEFDARYLGGGHDPDACPRPGCDGRMGLPPGPKERKAPGPDYARLEAPLAAEKASTLPAPPDDVLAGIEAEVAAKKPARRVRTRSEVAKEKAEAHLPVWERAMNPEQLEAIRHQDGPCVLLAGAGSGKTRVGCHRVARMVAEGVPGERILVVTFSTKAKDEMNERVTSLGVSSARVGTWHSLCLQILKEDRTKWAGWKIDEKNRAEAILKTVIGYKHLNWRGSDFTKVRQFVGWCKAHLWAPASREAAEHARRQFGGQAELAVRAFDLYNEHVEEAGLLTFDDFLVFAHAHLSIEENRAKWAAKWDYVIQDEAQDASPAQCEIALLLAKDHRNYMVIGDLRQSIYGFRGAAPKYLAEFATVWGAKVIDMNRNYRSARKIVAAANAIIRPAGLSDLRAERELEGSVAKIASANLDAEAAHFAAWARGLVENDGAKWSDVTALFRTNAQSRALEEALLRERIPYVVVGGTSFYERKEVKDLLAYLRVASGKDLAGDSVKRCINAPFRFLGAAFTERLTEHGAEGGDWGKSVRAVAAQAGIQSRQRASAEEWARLVAKVAESIANEEKPSQILADIINRTQYVTWLQKEEGEESVETSHAANVRELVRVAERFASAESLLAYIEENAKAARKQREDKQAGGERVLLMSIHRSKGLEWSNVFVSGCNEGILPHAKGDVAEERRLAYVAATRARDSLVLSYVLELASAAGIKRALPSRFLADAAIAQASAPEPAAALPELRELP
jgi:DNA helicase-2/ATP-dependent DNA helicase PcrA